MAAPAVDYQATFKNLVMSDVMACIGCNDCMLACPLPETQLISIAELNAAVDQQVITNPYVIDFVTACTQCRQCVPVCPADLSRADIVLYNKLKVEDVVHDRPLKLQIGKSVVETAWTLDALTEHVAHIPLFENVDPRAIRRMLLKATLRQLAPGEVLCYEGQFHERLFVIIEGVVEQSATNWKQERSRILVLGPGSFHGDLAVLSDQPEVFTVTALQPSIVLEIPKTTLLGLMHQSPRFKEIMDTLYQRRAIWTYIKDSPLLESLPEKAIEDLLAGAQLDILPAGEVILEEGQQIQDFYLVRTGFLRVSRQIGSYGERVLVYFRQGDSFGALSLMTGTGKVNFSVKANTPAEIIRIPGKLFREVLNRFPDFRSKILAEAAEAEQVLRSQDLNPLPQPPLSARENTTQISLSWTGLIDRGILQGHEVLVIDQRICTDCNNCVDACGRRHGYSRLERGGLQMGHLLFPTACRHCEDPVCLLCSVNGIVRQPDGEITIVTDNCIGCGACAQRCPYGNIHMHPIEESQKKGLLRKLYHYIIERPRIKPVFDENTPHIAVKCDLCSGYNDYACVTACPVGAAARINPVEAFGKNNLFIGLERKRESGENQV